MSERENTDYARVSRPLMAEKKDLLGRSKKKIKGDGEGFFGESSQHVSYAGIHEPIEDKMVGLKGDEYKNALLGGSDEEFSLLIEEDMDDDWNVDEEENKELEDIKVVEKPSFYLRRSSRGLIGRGSQ